MNNIIEIITKPISVWSVSCTGVANSAQAFTCLESKLPTLKGRKFYGCLVGNPDTGVYRACVAKIDSNNTALRTFAFGERAAISSELARSKLESWIIPGGKYLKTKIKNWLGHEDLISQTFSQMSKNITVDPTRPCIEFYKSQRELILLLPIN